MKLPKRSRFKLTGETFTEAIAGLPTASCHHGTKIEIAISNRVEIPATNAIMLILFCINSTYNIKRDVASVNGSAGLDYYAVHSYLGADYEHLDGGCT